MTSAEQAVLRKRLADLKAAMNNRSINAVNLTELVGVLEDVVVALPVTDPAPERPAASFEPRGRA